VALTQHRTSYGVIRRYKIAGELSVARQILRKERSGFFRLKVKEGERTSRAASGVPNRDNSYTCCAAALGAPLNAQKVSNVIFLAKMPFEHN